MITYENTMQIASMLTPETLAILAEEFEDTPEAPEVQSTNLITEAEWESVKHGLLPLHARWWALSSLGYLPKGFAERLKEASKQAEFYTPSTALATVHSVIHEEAGLKRWKEEQKLIRMANNSRGAAAVVTDGKWDDAWVREWPPLTASDGTGIRHAPARYVVKLPDGTRIDMGKPQGKLAGVFYESPDRALQGVCTRLGKRVNGSFEKVLNILAGGGFTDGQPDFVPSQMTVLYKGQWTIVITVMRNPKLALSHYAQEADGSLVPVDARNEPDRLSVTRFTHAVISAPSVEWNEGQSEGLDDDDWQARAISHAEARVIDVEEGEEFDAGAKMLSDACMAIGRGWELLTGSEEHTRPEFRLGLAQLAKAALKTKRKHKRYARAIYLTWAQPGVGKEMKQALWKSMQRQSRLAREAIDDYREAKEKMFHDLANPEPVCYAAPKFTMKPRKRDKSWTTPVMEPLDWNEGRTAMPANEVERRPLLTADEKPQGRVSDLLRAPWGASVVMGASRVHTMPSRPVVPTRYATLSVRARLVVNALYRKDVIGLALRETRRVERALARA